MTDIYSRLGVTPVINGIGNKTTLGGSTPSARAKQAMEEADYYYCSMPELMERTGERVAELLGVEGGVHHVGVRLCHTSRCCRGDGRSG